MFINYKRKTYALARHLKLAVDRFKYASSNSSSITYIFHAYNE